MCTGGKSEEDSFLLDHVDNVLHFMLFKLSYCVNPRGTQQ